MFYQISSIQPIKPAKRYTARRSFSCPAIGLLMVSVLLLTGCSSLSRFVPKSPSVAKNTQHEQAQSTRLMPVYWQAPHEVGFLKQELTGLFNTAEPTRLIQYALSNNPNLQQTAIRLKEQRLVTGQSRSARLPMVNLSSSASRSELSSGTQSTSYSLGLSANWEIDLWGKLADQSQAGQYDLQATQADYQAARNSLAAQVVRHWVSLAAQQQIIQLEQRRIVALQKTEASSLDHFKIGNGNLAQVASTRRAAASAKAGLIQRNATLAQTKRALNVLLGRSPNANLALSSQLPSVRRPLTQVPSAVMGARPDLQAAYARIRAADKRTAVAYKQLLPSISLAPSFTPSGSSLSSLLSGNPAWQLLGQLTGSLFDGGSKRAQVGIQSQTAQRAALLYRETLLTALKEVEDALSEEVSAGQQLVVLTQADQQAQISAKHYREQYRAGIATVNDVLSAEQSIYDSRINLLETQRSRLENRINLALALGIGI